MTMRGINRLEDFLKLPTGEAKKYDFSTEKASENYCELDSVERYIVYKSYTIYDNYGNSEVFTKGRNFVERVHDSYNGIMDPDVDSELLQDIYRKIWPDLYCEEGQGPCSDTMTSVQYTVDDYFERYIESSTEKANREQILSEPGRKQKCTLRYLIDLWAKTDPELGECIEKSAVRLQKIPEIANFLGAFHTLGNYCPVPSGFNAPRSFFGKYDFWDLTLMKIKEWYCSAGLKSEDERQNMIRHELFHGNAYGDVSSCIKWLGRFGTGMVGWRSFIDYFYLNDWVDEDYEVKPLWDGHSWENPLLPEGKDDTEDDMEDFFREYFLEYERRIHRRAETIICVLKDG